MSKTGLVLEGGGMKCAYAAGVLDKFLDDNINFDYVIGVSAGSANGLSYLAGQRGRNLRFYTEHIYDKGYLGIKNFLKTGNAFGLDYIYSTITNSDGKDPLDYEKVMSNHAEYECVATNALTGAATFFSKEHFQKDNYLEIKASSAIPGACKPVMIEGIPYFDGSISDALPIGRALEKKCQKIVVITSKPRDFVRHQEKHRWLYASRCAKYPKVVQTIDEHHMAYNYQFRAMLSMEKSGNVFIIAPSKHLNTSTFAKNAETNMKMYNLGLSDYEFQKENLLRFLDR